MHYQGQQTTAHKLRIVFTLLKGWKAIKRRLISCDLEEYKKFKFQGYWNTACPLVYVLSMPAFVLRGQSRAVVTETHEAHRA